MKLRGDSKDENESENERSETAENSENGFFDEKSEKSDEESDEKSEEKSGENPQISYGSENESRGYEYGDDGGEKISAREENLPRKTSEKTSKTIEKSKANEKGQKTHEIYTDDYQDDGGYSESEQSIENINYSYESASENDADESEK